MQFTPDYRNLGGRSLIVSQVWGHRVCLQQIKERNVKQCPIIKKIDSQPSQEKVMHEKNLLIHRKKLQDIQECITERNSKAPSYFFRRLPSPHDSQLKLLSKRPLNYKSKSTQEKQELGPPQQIDIDQIIPHSARSQVDWKQLIGNLRGPDYPLKKWIKNIAFSYQICDDNDFATLIRILLQAYKLKQSTLVNIVAEIIEELER